MSFFRRDDDVVNNPSDKLLNALRRPDLSRFSVGAVEADILDDDELERRAPLPFQANKIRLSS